MLEAEKAAIPKPANPSDWAKEAVDWAVKEGLFTGDGNGNFRWRDNITREEAAVVLRRFFKILK